MIRITSLLSILALLLFSCNKEVDSPEENYDDTEVYAGVVGENCDEYDYQPEFSVSISWDSQNLYGTGHDSLDLDFNGTCDVFLSLQILNIDSLHLLNGNLPDPIPSCRIETSDEFELAFYTEYYQIGLGQSASVSYLDCLELSDGIHNITDWRSSGNMWKEGPGQLGTPPFGKWNQAGSSNFIALRRNGDELGWIEVNGANQYFPTIKRCVIYH